MSSDAGIPPYDPLIALAATDTRAAIREASRIVASGGNPSECCSAAGALIDIGSRLGDDKVVRAGLAAISRQARREPANGLWQYQRGTGYITLASTAKGTKEERREKTQRERVRGRRALWEAATSDLDPSTRAQAWVNLGNDLYESGRYVEAYGAYQEALRVCPGHPVAAGYSASVLFYWARLLGADSGNLVALAHHWGRIAQADLALAEATASGSSKLFETFPTALADEAVPPAEAGLSGYDEFVARHRLYLSWALDGATEPCCWDSLIAPEISVPIDAGPDTPSVIAMLNSLKADFLLARRLAWEAIESDGSDAHLYTDTLDYAAYGDGTARSILATRAALDVLDRVAVAANHYFGFGISPGQVDFRTLWREPRHPRTMRPPAAAEVSAGNISMYALVEMADDLSGHGWLEGHQRFRNVATHRFVVAHVESWRIPTPTSDIHRLTVQDLDDEVGAALGATRSGILYLHGAIGNHEHRKGPSGLHLPLPPSIVKARY
jgi:tetratricopeptide (TPR) repeat protein